MHVERSPHDKAAQSEVRRMTGRMLALLVALLVAVAGPVPAGAGGEGDPVGGDRAGHGRLVACEGSARLLSADAGTQTVLPGGAPVGVSPCPGIRPGAHVRTTTEEGANKGCTLNFVVRGTQTSDGVTVERTFIGTGGHCVLDSEGHQVWGSGRGPVSSTMVGGSWYLNLVSAGRVYEPFGRVVYATWGGGRDFALIEVDEDAELNPQMCHFGGPTGVMADLPPLGSLVEHSGQGNVYGAIVPGRTGVTNGLHGGDSFAFAGAAIFGDSGSPLLRGSDGAAAGVIVSISPLGVHAQHFAAEMDLAAKNLRLDDWEIVTAERTSPLP